MRRSGAPPRDAEFGTYGVVRPIVFILLVATSLSHSFLPLYMEELYQPLLGLSHEMVVGLPISAEMLCAGLMIGVSGAWIDRRGWHEPFLAGLLLCAVGSLLSALAGGQIALILARGAFGLGYGLAWMAGQGFVINHTDSATKARGMACFVAAVYSGSICGAATGGMLAERIGYSHVFLAAMGVCLFGFVFTMLLMRGYFRRPQRTGAGWAIDFRAIRQLMCNRNVVLLLVARSIPTAVALIGFLYYFCPIYLDSYGFSQANIARVLMVFGLFMIYVAPLMSRWVDRSARKKPFIVGAGLLGGAGLASFFVLDGMVGVLAAVTLFSLSFSFASSSHVVFFLNLERTMSVGAGEAMGAYRALEKIGQVLGPIAVAAFFGLAGVEKGVAWLGVATMAATLLFALGAREPSPGRGRG
jgi:predicted MFS family arabinose efflux permease